MLLPWMIYIVALLVRCATRSSVGAEDAKTRRLQECQRRAASVRRRVKLTLAGSGWLLLCVWLTYQIAPTVLSGGKSDMFSPWWSYNYGFLVVPAAIALMFLGLQPTDAIAIRIACVVSLGLL